MNKRHFIVYFASIHLIFIGAVIINQQNFGFSFLQTIVGLPFVLIIPGFLIGLILNLQKGGAVKLLIYSVALSLCILMGMGFLLNILLPPLNIAPFTSLIMIASIIFLNILLGLIYLIKVRPSENPQIEINLNGILNPHVLATILILFISIIGSLMVNYFDIIIVRWLFFFTFAIIAFLGLTAKRISTNQRAGIIFLLSLSLLYQTIFLSSFLWGQDIHLENYLAQSVINSGTWNSGISINVNAMLSITVLGPFLSIIPDITSMSALMFVYPIIFSLVPVSLFLVWMGLTNEKIAYIAVVFFISLFIFYGEMVQLARQQIAEVFFAVFILVIFDSKQDHLTRKMMAIVFFFSVIVSHYGTAYMAIGFLAGALIFNWILNQIARSRKYQTAYNIDSDPKVSDSSKGIYEYSSSLVILFCIFAITWYAYNSNSTNIHTFVDFINNLVSSIMNETINNTPQGMAIVTTSTNLLHSFTKYLQLLFQFFILFGFISIVLGKSKWKIHKTYINLAFSAIIVLIFSLFLPYFASAFNTTRIYQISIIILSPLFAIGILESTEYICKRITLKKHRIHISLMVNLIVGGLLVCFLLMNSGTIYGLLNDNPTPIRENTNVDTLYFNEMEILGARWICQERIQHQIFADDYRRYLIGNFDWIHSRSLSEGYPDSNSSYIFLGEYNLIRGEVLISSSGGALLPSPYTKIGNSFEDRNVIYRSHGAKILL